MKFITSSGLPSEIARDNLCRTVAAVLAMHKHVGLGHRQLLEERPVALLNVGRQNPASLPAGRHLEVLDPFRGDHRVW
jgi:hypothetical protein